MRGDLIPKPVRRRTGGAALLAMLVFSSPAAAAAVCTVSPQGVNFGTYDRLSASPLDGVGNINVSCDAVTSFSIALGAGGGSYASRSMTSGVDRMSYNLYTGAARLVVWGDGTGNTDTVSATSTGGDFTVYGQVPAGQNLPASSYADMIVVTVTY